MEKHTIKLIEESLRETRIRASYPTHHATNFFNWRYVWWITQWVYLLKMTTLALIEKSGRRDLPQTTLRVYLPNIITVILSEFGKAEKFAIYRNSPNLVAPSSTISTPITQYLRKLQFLPSWKALKNFQKH